MGRHGKKYCRVRDAVADKTYTLDEAIVFLKDNATARFDETAEIAFRLGVDPRKSDQSIRGTVTLPHGSGKKVRVLVFAIGAAAEAASGAGADFVGFEDMVQKIKDGWTDFDVAIATPDAMKEVRKLGRVLGPRGLMPNPRTGTVTTDTATAVEQCKAGRVEFRMDRHGNLQMPFGKLSFAQELLRDNVEAAIDAVRAAKPPTTRGVYIKRCTVSSTMGVGLTVDVQD